MRVGKLYVLDRSGWYNTEENVGEDELEAKLSKLTSAEITSPYESTRIFEVKTDDEKVIWWTWTPTDWWGPEPTVANRQE